MKKLFATAAPLALLVALTVAGAAHADTTPVTAAPTSAPAAQSVTAQKPADSGIKKDVTAKKDETKRTVVAAKTKTDGSKSSVTDTGKTGQ